MDLSWAHVLLVHVAGLVRLWKRKTPWPLLIHLAFIPFGQWNDHVLIYVDDDQTPLPTYRRHQFRGEGGLTSTGFWLCVRVYLGSLPDIR